MVGNRDENFERPTASLSQLDNGVYCGIDLVHGGTWLGIRQNKINESVRFAYLTNYTEPRNKLRLGTASRGLIPMEWLSSDKTPQEFLCSQDFSNYSGMNLVIGISTLDQPPDIYATSNRGMFAADENRFQSCEWGAIGATYTVRFRTEVSGLEPFAVALCNGNLGEQWVKVSRCEEGAKNLSDFSDESLFELMQDETPCSGVINDIEEEEEDKYTPIFIIPEIFRGKVFGTRSTTVLRVLRNGELSCVERNHIEHIDVRAFSNSSLLDDISCVNKHAHHNFDHILKHNSRVTVSNDQVEENSN